MLVALMMPQGVWADELTNLTGDAPVFSLATTGTSFGTNGSSSAGETKYTKDGIDYWMMDLNPAVIAVGASDGAAWTFTNNTQYIKVVLANNIKVGDFIVINGSSDAKGGYRFRIFDNSTSSTSGADGLAFADYDMTTSAADYTFVVTSDNCLIGKNTFYLRWSSGNKKGSLNSIKVYSGPAAITTNKIWDFTGFNTLAASDAGMTSDNLFYGKGISITTIEGTQVLNLPKNGSTFNANNSLAMFMVNGKGKVTFTYYANASGTKPFAHKIGIADGVSESLGEKKFKTSWFTFNVDEDTAIYLYTADNSSGTFYLKDITVTFTPTIPINTIDYATFSSSEALDFTGLSQKAYIVTAQSDGKLTYQQVNKVPAATGLLIVGAAGETVKPAFLAKDDAAETITTNLLKPTLTATTVGTTEGADYGKVWVLGNKSGAGFYKANNGRSLAVGKAYLYLDGGISAAREFFAFDFDDETTGVADTRGKMEDVRGEYFDLQGRKVAQPAKGLYIKNGKKYVIK